MSSTFNLRFYAGKCNTGIPGWKRCPRILHHLTTSRSSLFSTSDAKQANRQQRLNEQWKHGLPTFSSVHTTPASLLRDTYRENDFYNNAQTLPKAQRRPGALLASPRLSRIVQSCGAPETMKKYMYAISRSLSLSLALSLPLDPSLYVSRPSSQRHFAHAHSSRIHIHTCRTDFESSARQAHFIGWKQQGFRYFFLWEVDSAALCFLEELFASVPL